MPVVQFNETNLFTKHFIMGCKEVDLNHTKTITKEIEAIHAWIDWKDNDWAMKRYRSSRTQYIDFLEIIELGNFKELIHDLARLYLVDYPYSKTKDFIEYTFGYTLFELKRYVDIEFYFLSDIPNIQGLYVCNYFSREDNEFIEIIIDEKFTYDNYRQYYQRVIELIEEFDYSHLDNESKIDSEITDAEVISEKIPDELSEKVTKSKRLFNYFSEYGFFTIDKVKNLSPNSKERLLSLIFEGNLGYKVSMLEHLGYFKFLENEYFNLNKTNTNKKVSSWFDSDTDGRSIRGNRNSFNKEVALGKGRYNAYKYKEKVEKDYQILERE